MTEGVIINILYNVNDSLGDGRLSKPSNRVILPQEVPSEPFVSEAYFKR